MTTIVLKSGMALGLVQAPKQAIRLANISTDQQTCSTLCKSQELTHAALDLFIGNLMKLVLASHKLYSLMLTASDVQSTWCIHSFGLSQLHWAQRGLLLVTACRPPCFLSAADFHTPSMVLREDSDVTSSSVLFKLQLQ